MASKSATRSKPFSLEVSFAHSGWKKIPKLEIQLQLVMKMVLAHLPGKFHFPCTANLLLTSDAAIRQLNRDFRGMDKPTNVLSFPQFTPQQLSKKGKSTAPVELGDIAIACQYVVVEAKKDHKILINHVIHLFIHGLLHLFGYDHMSDTEAEKMERLEKRIMAELGLPDPYKPATSSKRQKPKTKARVKAKRART